MINPVLKRELVTTLRSWKSFSIIGIYVICLSAIIFVFKNAMVNRYDYSFAPESSVSFYIFVSSMQISAVCLLIPALTAGSINGERERQTLDLLLMTKMSHFSIIIGKIMASMSFVVLLIITSLPIFSFMMYFGSLNIFDLIIITLYTLTTAFMLASISVFMSCKSNKVTTAIAVTYIWFCIICIMFYPTITFHMINNPNNLNYGVILCAFLTSPVLGFISLVDTQFSFGFVDNFLYIRTDNEPSGFVISCMENLWAVHMGVQIIVACLFIFFATKSLNPVKNK